MKPIDILSIAVDVTISNLKIATEVDAYERIGSAIEYLEYMQQKYLDSLKTQDNE